MPQFCYFAIEIIGEGRRARYCVKRVDRNGTTPTDGKVYKTCEDAQRAAADMGIRIKRTGNLWEILPRPWDPV